MLQRARKVKALENMIIVIRFDNDEIRLYNCYPLLQNRLFKKLEDKDFFRTVHVDDMGLVCWDNATDIEPNVLFNESVPITEAEI